MLTQNDEQKIQQFFYALEGECSKRGCRLAQGRINEEGNESYGVWLVGFTFQIHTAKYELYVNLNVQEELHRYGWRYLGGIM